MAVLVYEDVIGLDVSAGVDVSSGSILTTYHGPMYESKLMHCFYGQNALCNVEPRDVLRECIIFDQHRHEVATRQELHNQI